MTGPRRRKRGEIAAALPSSSLRVKVYAGGDTETARTRRPAQVDEHRNPRTRSTVNGLRA